MSSTPGTLVRPKRTSTEAESSAFSDPPHRSAPFDVEPGLHQLSGLWLFGNARLLDAHLAHIESASGLPHHLPRELDEVEKQAEQLVLSGKVLVTGIHSPAHMRAAVVPLRWGSPRIVILSGGFTYHLGKELDQEPFRAGRLWRYKWDPTTDLAISRRAPGKLPTFGHHNPTVDRMIRAIVRAEWTGLRWHYNGNLRVLV